jgi:DNA polymerase III alpha subunit
MSYTELQVTSHFSFLRGVSSAEELFVAAAGLAIPALGIVDRNSLAGVVRAHEAAKVTGVRLIVGCRLDLVDFASLLVYPTDRAAYGRLCRLLTIGKARAGKGKCTLHFQDVAAWCEGLIAILVTDKPGPALAESLAKLCSTFGDRAYCALTRRFRPDDAACLQAIAKEAARAGIPTVVTGDVLYHVPGRRMLQDVVTCIRLKTTVDKAGFLKERHADRFLKAPAEMKRLFRRYPDAVARTQEIAKRCTFSLDELTYCYPTEVLEDGLSAQERLEKLTWEGAEQRYPQGIPDTMQLRHELNLIERVQYAPYFLTVDALKFMKVDVLGLGMLGCMNRAFDLLRKHKATNLDLATIPAEDPATYEMTRAADTVGVFQIESRAQMAMLPRLAPKRFYDLVIEVAIVRPGPIQGDMVHPYLRRREGKEPVVFPKPELEKVLGKTLGVPLFQEQAMQVAMVAAGFSATEADQLRRAMATFKFTGGVNKFRNKLIKGMIDNGYDNVFAERTFKQLEGFERPSPKGLSAYRNYLFSANNLRN